VVLEQEDPQAVGEREPLYARDAHGRERRELEVRRRLCEYGDGKKKR
jgi:hypothetical protein